MKKIILSTLVGALLLPVVGSAQDQESGIMEPPPPPPVVQTAPAEKAHAVLDNLDWKLLASGYYLFNTNRVAGSYTGGAYPYSDTHGFGLNFVGGGASYMGDKVGITIDIYYEPSGGPALSPIAPLKQGYLTYKPKDKLTLDFGFFDTIYGAEVADEWENANFSRGVLYFLRQPFNHLGVRAGYEISEKLALNVLVVNGAGLGAGAGGVAAAGAGVPDAANIDRVPNFGGQVVLSPSDDLGIALGYMAGPNGTDRDGNWGHFIDVVLTYDGFEKLSLALNGDFTFDPHAGPGLDAILYGVMGSVIYSCNANWAIGGRLEYIGGNADSGAPDQVTATATVRYMPVPQLVFSLEPRYEYNQARTFAKTGSGPKKNFLGILLGASVHLGSDS